MSRRVAVQSLIAASRPVDPETEKWRPSTWSMSTKMLAIVPDGRRRFDFLCFQGISTR